MRPQALAFPNPTRSSSEPGLTIRDYIAIEMAKGIVSANPKKIDGVPEEKQVAVVAYILADALIAESNK